MSKGDVPFRIPDYVEDSIGELIPEKPNLTLHMPSVTNPNISKLRGEQWSKSPDVSPHSARPPPSSLSGEPSRVSSVHGPVHDFEEARVSFISLSPKLPLMNFDDDDDDDDESDDGLFAAPLARAGPPAPAKNESVEQGKSRSQPPKLRLKTQRSKTSLPKDVEKPVEQSTNPERDALPSDFHPESAASATWTDSPDDTNKFSRRESFASDVWANRPPAEQLVDHLDELFPNVNLDQPMMEEEEDTVNDSLNELSRPPPPTNFDEGLATQQPLMRGKAGLQTIAQRNLRKSGVGIGRTKSIRDVGQVAVSAA